MVILQLREQPALIQAIFAGDLAATEAILCSNDEVNLLDVEKRTALHAAAFRADAEITAALLKAGAKVNAKDSKWVTPLHRACSINADKVVDLLLNASADAGARDRLWQTPLHIAAANNAYECVELLAEHIPNIDVPDRSGKTALHHAAHHGHTSVVELLISKGSKVDAADKKYFRPLHFAAQMGHLNTVDCLIKSGADIDAFESNQCYNPLHIAAANGNGNVCRLLLNAGAYKNAQNTYGNTPLHIACLNGQLMVCQDLINAGAFQEAENFKGQTPLHIAAASPHGAECMMFLLSQKADVNARSLDGRTPLHMTALYGKLTRSTSLIDHGAVIDSSDKNGCTPLHIAAQYGHDLLVTTLISFGADPSLKGFEGRTPLHMSCLSGNIECCRKFLMAGVDVNAIDDTGKTPIHLAAYMGYFECIDLLVSNGAKFCEKDNIGRVPLHYAALQGHYQCVFTLVDLGTPVNIKDDQGCTPLHFAAANDFRNRYVGYLLQHKADPSSEDNKGLTPLHYAVAGDNTEAGLLLLSSYDYKAAVRNRCETLVTPLHLAAKVGNHKILNKLIEDGADVNAQDEQGTTPLMVAIRGRHSECAITLVLAGASVSICDKINDMTAIHYCARNGYHECLQQIFRRNKGKECIAMKDSLQRTPLMLAVSSNHFECVKDLLNYSEDAEKLVNMVDNDLHSSLFRAVASGNSKIVQLLLEKKAKANAVDINGKSLTHLAAACGNLTCFQILLDYLEQNEAAAMDKQECTALHWACYRGNASCVELLLKNNIFKDMQGNKFSPLHCACYSGSIQCLQLLLNYFGKNIVNSQDSRKRYPLHICALHGCIETAMLLIEQGASLDVLDEDERTPLIAAAQFGKFGIIKSFLNLNVNESHQDKYGNTALHWASTLKDPSTAKTLLENLKDNKVIHIVNKENKTALHMAARNGNYPITRLLLKKGASVFAVDSNGFNPALCCAPNHEAAQCLALILLNMNIGASGESDPKNFLTSFLKTSKQSYPNNQNSSALKTHVNIQTDEIFPKKYDLMQIDQDKTSFNPPLWSIEQKILIPSKYSTLKPIFKSTWKKNNSRSSNVEDGCFLIDNSDLCGQSGTQEIECDKGLNLHRSFSDMSISSHNDGKINLEETLKVYNLKELSDRKKGCKECLLWQKRCSDCTLRLLLRQHLQGKRSPKEFNEFLLKLLNESSTEYRQKLFSALEALGKGFGNPYNRDLTPDLRHAMRLSKNKINPSRNKRMLCKMDPLTTTSSGKSSDGKNITKPKNTDGSESTEVKIQQEILNSENAPIEKNHQYLNEITDIDVGKTQLESNTPIDSLHYQEFVTELLKGDKRPELVLHPEFLKRLQDLKMLHPDQKEEYFEVMKGLVNKLLDDKSKGSEIHNCERFVADDDILRHIEILLERAESMNELYDEGDELKKLENPECMQKNSYEYFENLGNDEMNDQENMESELCPFIVDKSELEKTKEDDPFHQQVYENIIHPNNRYPKMCANGGDNIESQNDRHCTENLNENFDSIDDEFY